MVRMPGGRNRQHIGGSISLLWSLHLSCKGTGAGVIGVALYSAATLLVCMPAGWKDKRANFRFFALAQYLFKRL